MESDRLGADKPIDKMISIAGESEKTKKARMKLQKKLEKLDKQVTQDGLKRKVQEIHNWISRHASHRTVLKDKNISLFDENQNAAPSSMKVVALLGELKKGNFSGIPERSSKIDLSKKIDNVQTN